MSRELVAPTCALCAFVLVVAGCKEETPAAPPEKVCSGAQALSAATIGGASLPAKTLALTFDDGPGDRTAELSAFLKAEGVRATFFINGVYVTAARQAVLATLVADGHELANHSQNHLNLTQQTPAKMVSELAETDAIIAPFVPANRFLFRPPFGAYDQPLHAALTASAMSKYVGPITWEIGDALTATSGADWDCWDAANGTRTTQQCGDLYIQEAETKGRGIVLMHDPFTGPTGNTVDMVKYMLPILKTKGFKFARVDEVPEIAALLPPLPPADAGVEAGPADSGAPPADSGVSSPGGGATTVRPDPCPPASPTPARFGESGGGAR